jgi:dCTP deaminase
MSVLRGASIKKHIPIDPAVWEKTRHESGMTYGLSEAGYDIRLTDNHESSEAKIDHGRMVLVASLEHFQIPKNVIAFVHDKSTLARLGLAVQNTVLEPGWIGHITLELSFHGNGAFFQLYRGMPIAQVCFHWLDGDAEPYNGRYQDQAEEPVTARF